MEPPRVVLDTSMIVAGLRSKLCASNRLLGLVAEERLMPLVTTALFLEYEEALKRLEQRFGDRNAREGYRRFHGRVRERGRARRGPFSVAAPAC